MVLPTIVLTILTSLFQELVQLANALVIAQRRRITRLLEMHVLVVRELLVSVVDRNNYYSLLISLTLLDSCTCEKAADGGLLPDEIDFTTKA